MLKFQDYLVRWRIILHKERWGIPLTKAEERMKWEPRTAEHVLAELAAGRYGFLA